MIIFPSSSDYGIASDRIDACANAFSTLISMDVHRFNSCAQALIARQSAQLQQPMMCCLHRLISSNRVDINKFADKKNRLLFVKNFGIFVAEIRPLVTYH